MSGIITPPSHILKKKERFCGYCKQHMDDKEFVGVWRAKPEEKSRNNIYFCYDCEGDAIEDEYDAWAVCEQWGVGEKPLPQLKSGQKYAPLKEATINPSYGGYDYTYKLCSHKRTPYMLIDEGPCVYLSSNYGGHTAKKAEPKEGEVVPDLTVGLASSWTPKGGILMSLGVAKVLGNLDSAPKQPPFIEIDWPDQGIPENTDELIWTAGVVAQLVFQGLKVEFGCMGGHGRTGTFAAMLSILYSKLHGEKQMTWAEAVDRVRDTYCDKAVESFNQEWFLYELSPDDNPPVNPRPKKYILPWKGTSPTNPVGAPPYKPKHYDPATKMWVEDEPAPPPATPSTKPTYSWTPDA